MSRRRKPPRRSQGNQMRRSPANRLQPTIYCTSSFIWMSGIKMAMAMKPTTPPSSTIISGSSKLVSATTRVFDVRLVGAAHVFEHRFELPGLLTDRDHVRHHGREHRWRASAARRCSHRRGSSRWPR